MISIFHLSKYFIKVAGKSFKEKKTNLCWAQRRNPSAQGCELDAANYICKPYSKCSLMKPKMLILTQTLHTD